MGQAEPRYITLRTVAARAEVDANGGLGRAQIAALEAGSYQGLPHARQTLGCVRKRSLNSVGAGLGRKVDANDVGRRAARPDPLTVMPVKSPSWAMA